MLQISSFFIKKCSWSMSFFKIFTVFYSKFLSISEVLITLLFSLSFNPSKTFASILYDQKKSKKSDLICTNTNKVRKIQDYNLFIHCSNYFNPLPFLSGIQRFIIHRFHGNGWKIITAEISSI